MGIDGPEPWHFEQRGRDDVGPDQHHEVWPQAPNRRDRVPESPLTMHLHPTVTRPVGKRPRGSRAVVRAPAKREVPLHDAQSLFADARKRLIDERRSTVEDRDVDSSIQQARGDPSLPLGRVDSGIARDEQRLHAASLARQSS